MTEVALPSRMDRGYRLTHYVAGPISAHIGARSPSADAWLAAHRAATAVLISAWNPMSRRRSANWNRRAHARLRALLGRRPTEEGLSGAPGWQELMVAVPGDARFGRVLAARFRQRAFVLLRRNRPATLVYARARYR